MASTTRDDYRLSESDEASVVDAIAGAVAEWGAGSGRRYIVKASDYPTLERIAAHSIGCSTADLRDSELAWIADQIAAL